MKIDKKLIKELVENLKEFNLSELEYQDGQTKKKKKKNTKIKKLIVTDTIDNSKKINNNTKIEVLSISSLMSEAIKRIANSNSVSDLFN